MFMEMSVETLRDRLSGLSNETRVIVTEDMTVGDVRSLLEGRHDYMTVSLEGLLSTFNTEKENARENTTRLFNEKLFGCNDEYIVTDRAMRQFTARHKSEHDSEEWLDNNFTKRKNAINRLNDKFGVNLERFTRNTQ
jgi:hypothetical protein